MRSAPAIMLLKLLLIGLAAQLSSANPDPQTLATLKLLQAMGVPVGSVTRAKPLRPDDSPVYYIRMPSPHLQSNAIDFLGDYRPGTTTEQPFFKVPIKFTSNGRPEQVVYWKPNIYDSIWANKLEETVEKIQTTTTTTPRPTTTVGYWASKPNKQQISYIKKFTSNGKPSKVHVYKPGKPMKKPVFKRKTTTSRPINSTLWPTRITKYPTKKPLINYINNFISNGKPTSVYVYNPKKPYKKHILKKRKHKHPAFRHFNY